MKLRNLTFNITGLVLILAGLLAAIFFAIELLLSANDGLQLKTEIKQVEQTLAAENEDLQRHVGEIAYWDVLSDLVKKQTQRKRRVLIKKITNEKNKISFLLLIDTSQQLIYKTKYKADLDKYTHIDDKTLFQLVKNFNAFSRLADKTKAGYVYSDGLYSVASAAVYSAEEEDVVVGRVIVGRKISTKNLQQKSLVDAQVSGINLALHPGQLKLLKLLKEQSLYQTVSKFEVSTGFKLLSLFNEPVAIISLSREKSDIKSLLSVSWHSVVLLIFISLFIGLMVWKYKQNSLQKDIGRLVKDIEKVKVGTELSGRLSAENRRMLGSVVTAINQKIGGFEQSLDSIHTTGRRHDAEILLNELPLEAYLKDTDLKYVTVNQRYSERLGVSKDEIVGKTDQELAELLDINVFNDEELAAINSKESITFEESIEKTPGEKVFYTTNLIPFITDKGKVEGVVGVKIDITSHRRAEAELDIAGKVLENTAEGVMVTDAQCRIIHVNSSYSELTGYTEQELLGKVPLLLQKESRSKLYQDVQKSLEDHDIWSGELWSSRKDGSSYTELINIKVIRNKTGDITNYFSMSNDITEQKKFEEQLYQMAHYDSLTGLPNRTLFKDRLKQEIVRTQRSNKHIGVLFLDLDLFKSINDSLGHAAGDELLIVVAERLKSTLRNADSIARLGGDEFTIMVTDLADDYNKNSNYLTRLCEKIIEVIKLPMDINGHEISATCSVGVTVYPVDAHNVEDLLRNADSAMYYAKSQGRRNYQFYSKELNEHAIERLEKEIEFRSALKNDLLELNYQPQIDVISRHVVGAEALLRWKKDGETILGPDKIVALAEETGMIFELGNWILNKACLDCKQWQDAGHHKVRVAVNLSTRQFRQKDLVEIVSGILKETELPARLLELEVTESALMENIEYSVEMMADLSRKGVRWSLDDFGTGYSSLTYLRDFPVHVLKVDQSFVKEITINPEDSAIVETIIDLAHRLHLTVIAEGVENAEQLKVLSRMNCEQIQGYYFSKPLKQVEFLEYVSQGVHV